MNQPTLSLITGLRNRTESFKRLLDSIQRNTGVDWELIVADASDIPITDQMEIPERVRILPERPRLGCTRGYNRAFDVARGKWVIWLNDDCEVMPGYAAAAIRFMERNPHIGLGALSYADDLQRVGFHTNTCMYGWLYANFGIISKWLGDAVGWFDEALPMYGNDNSLTYRVLIAGYGVAAVPGEHIIHHSVVDAMRQANDNERERDSQTLKTIYGPHLAQMDEIYRRMSVVVIA